MKETWDLFFFISITIVVDLVTLSYNLVSNGRGRFNVLYVILYTTLLEMFSPDDYKTIVWPCIYAKHPAVTSIGGLEIMEAVSKTTYMIAEFTRMGSVQNSVLVVMFVDI